MARMEYSLLKPTAPYYLQRDEEQYLNPKQKNAQNRHIL